MSSLLERLEMPIFKERWPWIGGDLQTLRDTFGNEHLPEDKGDPLEIPIPELPSAAAGPGYLLAFFDKPIEIENMRGIVLLLHGLGGSSSRLGLRRMGVKLNEAGFGVLRLNLRGADPGRHLAGGTYSASCNSDLREVFITARRLCREFSGKGGKLKKDMPLLGAGISLGGTILLNACLVSDNLEDSDKPLLDALVCTSSPLDLCSCSASIQRPRNMVYQSWLLKRLIRQTLEDPFGLNLTEKDLLNNGLDGSGPIRTIRDFDAAITAPRWGYKSVDEYYIKASPLASILNQGRKLPRTLMMQSSDDPWVPVSGLLELENSIQSLKDGKIDLVITSRGGHNGFHGIGGCWGDLLVERWFAELGF
nr:alpha/beta hydrolase [Prochlorococcus sp. MIT 1300]